VGLLHVHLTAWRSVINCRFPNNGDEMREALSTMSQIMLLLRSLMRRPVDSVTYTTFVHVFANVSKDHHRPTRAFI
jgi:hypothetical protein